jgi:hypothetical protein
VVGHPFGRNTFVGKECIIIIDGIIDKLKKGVS